MIDLLGDFINRVLSAIKGRISEKDYRRLENHLNKAKRRYRVMAISILAALNASHIKKADIDTMATLIEMAERNIEEGKPAFDLGMKKKLREIFVKAGLSEKAADKFALDFDSLMALEFKTRMGVVEEKGEQEESGKVLSYTPAFSQPEKKEGEKKGEEKKYETQTHS